MGGAWGAWALGALAFNTGPWALAWHAAVDSFLAVAAFLTFNWLLGPELCLLAAASWRFVKAPLDRLKERFSYAPLAPGTPPVGSGKG